MRFTLAVLSPLACVQSASSLSSTGAFVHLFEWPWSSIANECAEVLGPKGYSAVQISPPNEHIQGSQWWTRYQPVSYNITSRSGSRAAFSDMVNRCNAAGVEILADGVTNHMAAGSGIGVGGSSYGSRTFAAAGYSQSDFHHTTSLTTNCQVTDYTSLSNVQNCDLVGLPDLDTSSSKVRDIIAAYLLDLVSLGVSAFRIDAAKHQDASQMNGYLSKLPDGIFVFGEVIEGSGEAVTPQMYEPYCEVTEFDWAYEVAPNIEAVGKMQYLNTVGPTWGLQPSSSVVIFTDNHDTQRGDAPLTYKDGALYNLFNLYMLASTYGFPKVMSSYYFTDHDQGPPSSAPGDATCGDGKNWVCEHRWTGIANMVAWRASAVSGESGGSASYNNWTTGMSGSAIAFGRGKNAWVALNRDGSNAWSIGSMSTGLSAGNYCNVMVSDNVASCPTITVGSDGKISNVSVPSMGAIALHAGKMKK